MTLRVLLEGFIISLPDSAGVLDFIRKNRSVPGRICSMVGGNIGMNVDWK